MKLASHRLHKSTQIFLNRDKLYQDIYTSLPLHPCKSAKSVGVIYSIFFNLKTKKTAEAAFKI